MSNDFYQMCSRCIMDTTDPDIHFDVDGVCNHCHAFDFDAARVWFPNAEGSKRIETLFDQIKRERKKYNYDCIMGLSGGLDSSYLALILKKYQMRTLVVHVDTGWNSELAVYNIERVVKYCDFDLYTRVMSWPEIRDLQVSYLRAGVANQDVVQDHAIFASLYHFAVSNNINYVMSGGNFATESVFPNAWHHDAMDSINLKAIHDRYGLHPLVDYKVVSFFQYYFYYPFLKRMKVIRPLNFLPYSKEVALAELQESVGYKPYGRKHGESRFTKFFQNHYLPVKFNMDKRRPHLSSMVLSGMLTRQQALEELDKPLYEEQNLREDMFYVAKKLGITVDELNILVKSPGHSYTEYFNWDSRYAFIKRAQAIFLKYFRVNLKNYS